MITVGYVRLSKEDENRKSNSIENQKLIISQYAEKHGIEIQSWYEDNNISGYLSERPAFQRLLQDLKVDIDTVIVKDLSRLGRKNSMVLSVLDYMAEQGKQMIAIDNHYDSLKNDDDTLGITTWFNDRYVKDISKKIRSSISARQKAGTLNVNLPFGYQRIDGKIVIVQEDAEIVRRIFKLYLSGMGYRRISMQLTDENIPTPSMRMKWCEIKNGIETKRRIAEMWSDNMVRDILKNDFYIGTLRLHKRSRRTIHGREHRVPYKDQYVFENHHERIVSEHEFKAVSSLRQKRSEEHYRGGSKLKNIFGEVLICRDCGSRLIKISRKMSNGVKEYYLCSAYNQYGTRYCKTSHRIEETVLKDFFTNYLNVCKEVFLNNIEHYNISQYKEEKGAYYERHREIEKEIHRIDAKLKIIMAQRVNALLRNSDSVSVIERTYDALESNELKRRKKLEVERTEICCAQLDQEEKRNGSAIRILESVIQGKEWKQDDISCIIEQITIDEKGFPEILLKHKITKMVCMNLENELNRRENRIILKVMELIYEERRAFTSGKYLLTKLNENGYRFNKSRIMPYINWMIEEGVLEKSNCSVKPYIIIMTREKIRNKLENWRLTI